MTDATVATPAVPTPGHGGPAPAPGSSRPPVAVPHRAPVHQRVEWSWRHGPVIGPANAGGAALSAGMVGAQTGVSPLWAAGAGAACAAAAVVRAAVRDVSPLGLVYRAGCWLGAGAWATWVLETTPWQPNALAALGIGVVVAGLAAPEMAEHEQRFTIAHAEERAAKARVDVAEDWEARLARVCQITGAVVEAVETWPGEVGMTLQVRLPAGGTTWRTIAGRSDQLAADADLPIGCAVEVGPGATRGVALIKVQTVDTTTIKVGYPDGDEGTSPLTINEPLPMGRTRGGQDVGITLLDDTAVLIGQTGSGKTNALQVANAGLVRSVDVLVWHIDLNGSGMSSPWMDPWLEGRTTRPVVDWVAATIEEAELMLTVAVAIAKVRKVAYRKLMKSVDDDKIPVSLEVPAIEIVLDEGAEAVAMSRGNTKVTSLLDTLVSIGRAARVRALCSMLRATSDIFPPSIKAQSGTRLFMRPTANSEHELAQLFGWRSGASLADVAQPGSGLLRDHSTPSVVAVQTMRITPAQIDQVAVACADRQPCLDQPSADAAGTAYTNRWDRYRTWLTANGGTIVTGSTPSQPADPNQPPNRPQSSGSAMEGMFAAGRDLEEMMKALRRLREDVESGQQPAAHPPVGDDAVEPAGNDGPDVDAAFAALTEGFEADADGPTWMLTLLREAGGRGLTADELVTRLQDKGVTKDRATIYRWLARYGCVALVDDRGARTGRWTPPST